MERLQRGRARSVARPIALLPRTPVRMWAEHPAVATAPVVRFQPLGPSRTGVGRPSLARTPVDPGAVVGAAVPSALAGPRARHPPRGQAGHGGRRRGRGGAGPAVVQLRPGPFPPPAGGWRWGAPVCPAAALFPGEHVAPCPDRGTSPGAGGGRPAASCRVALREQGALGAGCPASAPPPTRCPLGRPGGLGGWAQGFHPQAVPGGVLPRWGGPHALLPPVASPKVPPRLGAGHGMAEAPRGRLPGQSDVRPPRHAPLVTRRETLALLVEPPAVRGRRADAGLRGHWGEGRRPPMPGQPGAPRGARPPVRGPGGGGRAGGLCPQARGQPGGAWPTPARGGRRCGPEGPVSAPGDACGARACARLVRPRLHPVAHRGSPLPPGAPWAQAGGRRRPLGRPCGCHGVAPARLPRPFRGRGQATGALCRPPTCGEPETASRRGLASAPKRGGHAPPRRWGKRLRPRAPRGGLPAMLLAAPPSRQETSRPGRPPPRLTGACRAAPSVGRGSVQPRLAAADRPRALLPRDAGPGPQQGLARCCGALPLPPGFAWQPTGPPAASPGPSPRPGLLRASSSPVASGWHRLCGGTGRTADHWGGRRAPRPWVELGGRRAPPGVVTGPTGQSNGGPRLLLGLVAPACAPRALGDKHEGSAPSSLALPRGACEARGPGAAPRGAPCLPAATP
jgi:hypothetical protein